MVLLLLCRRVLQKIIWSQVDRRKEVHHHCKYSIIDVDVVDVMHLCWVV